MPTFPDPPEDWKRLRQWALEFKDYFSDATFVPADDSISTLKLQDGAVTNVKIADGAVTNSKLASNSVGTTNIADSTVTNSKLAVNSIGETNLASSSVTNSKLSTNSVGTTNIVNGAITGDKIDLATIGGDKLASAAITNSKVANDAIDNNNIVTGTITGIKLVDATITGAKISNDAITTTLIASGAVTADKLATNSVTSDKIIASAVTSTKIADGAVTGAKITNGTITGAKIANATIAGAKIDSSTFDLSKTFLIGASGAFRKRYFSHVSFDTTDVTTGSTTAVNFYNFTTSAGNDYDITDSELQLTGAICITGDTLDDVYVINVEATYYDNILLGNTTINVQRHRFTITRTSSFIMIPINTLINETIMRTVTGQTPSNWGGLAGTVKTIGLSVRRAGGSGNITINLGAYRSSATLKEL